MPEWVAFQKAQWGYATLVANATNMAISLFGDAEGELWYIANFTR